MEVYSEYGDVNHNGLPNWFEMLWFGKFGDMSTAGCCPDPNAMTPCGKTLLECYREQIDPTKELKPGSRSAEAARGKIGTSRSNSKN